MRSAAVPRTGPGTSQHRQPKPGRPRPLSCPPAPGRHRPQPGRAQRRAPHPEAAPARPGDPAAPLADRCVACRVGEGAVGGPAGGCGDCGAPEGRADAGRVCRRRPTIPRKALPAVRSPARPGAVRAAAPGLRHLPLLSGATGLPTGSRASVPPALLSFGCVVGGEGEPRRRSRARCLSLSPLAAERGASVRPGVPGPGLSLCARLPPGGRCAPGRERAICAWRVAAVWVLQAHLQGLKFFRGQRGILYTN